MKHIHTKGQKARARFSVPVPVFVLRVEHVYILEFSPKLKRWKHIAKRSRSLHPMTKIHALLKAKHISHFNVFVDGS